MQGENLICSGSQSRCTRSIWWKTLRASMNSSVFPRSVASVARSKNQKPEPPEELAHRRPPVGLSDEFVVFLRSPENFTFSVIVAVPSTSHRAHRFERWLRCPPSSNGARSISFRRELRLDP